MLRRNNVHAAPPGSQEKRSSRIRDSYFPGAHFHHFLYSCCGADYFSLDPDYRQREFSLLLLNGRSEQRAKDRRREVRSREKRKTGPLPKLYFHVQPAMQSLYTDSSRL